MPCRTASSLVGTLPADPHYGGQSQRGPEAVPDTHEQTLGSQPQGRAQNCPAAEMSSLTCCS